MDTSDGMSRSAPKQKPDLWNMVVIAKPCRADPSLAARTKRTRTRIKVKIQETLDVQKVQAHA